MRRLSPLEPRGALLPWLAVSLGLLESLHRMLLSGFRLVPGGPIDPRHLNYVLEHGYRWLRRDPGHLDLFELAMFHPTSNTGAYSEILIGLAPLYAPFRLLGAAPDTSLQLLLVAALALDFAAAYLLFRRSLGFTGLPAAMGAWLFTFAAVRTGGRLGHVHLLFQAFSLLALVALVEVFRRETDRRRWIVLFYTSLVAQLWSGFYLAWFLLLALAVLLLLALATAPSRNRLLRVLWDERAAVAIGAGLSVLAVWPLLSHFLEAAAVVGLRPWSELEPFLLPLKAWLNPSPDGWIYGKLASLPVFANLPFTWEKHLFPGLVTAALCVWGARHTPPRGPARLTLLTGGVLALLATAWPGGFSLWRVVYELVPGGAAVRAVSRIGLLLLLPLAILLAGGLRRLEETGRSRLGLALSALVLLEQGQSLPACFEKETERREVERIVASIPPGCGAFYYSPLPAGPVPWKAQVDAMWASMESGIPTVNGYSSNLPPGWAPLLDNALGAAENDSRLEAALRDWAVRSGIPRESICWVRVPSR